MHVHPLRIPEVKLLLPRIFEDDRGWFQESYSYRTMVTSGIRDVFVQDNHSLSQLKGTVRGLHFQIAPHIQGKLVRVIHGAVFDVAVDLRRTSPTYGQHVSAELSATNRAQMWVPPGFAHGFCTLEPNSEVIYKVTSYFEPFCDQGIRWDDPVLNIAWPVPFEQAILSEKDRKLQSFRDFSPATFS